MRRMRVEYGVEPERTVAFQIDAPRVDGTERHAVRNPVSRAVDDATHGFGIAGRTKLVPTQGISAEDLGTIKQKLSGAGIAKVVNWGVVKLPPDEAKCREVFEFAKKIGTEILVSEPEPAALDIIEKLCKEFRMKVAIHNHPRREKDPAYKVWDPDYVMSLLKDRDPCIGACADTGHWVRSGLDPVDSNAEAGRTVGTFLRQLVTGRLVAREGAHAIPPALRFVADEVLAWIEARAEARGFDRSSAHSVPSAACPAPPASATGAAPIRT